MAMGLGESLVEEGLLSAERLDEALRLARESNEPLLRILVRNRFVPEEPLLRAVARRQGMDFVALRDAPVEERAVRALSAKFVAHYLVMPLHLRGDTVTLAVATPFDMAATEDIETNLGYRVERVLACEADIREAIRAHYGVGADTVERLLADRPEPREAPRAADAQDLERMADEASVVRLVNQILHQAITERATDIHFEVYRGDLLARRRIDGVLHDTPVPRDLALLYPAMVSRIKLMAGLNIVERRLPQDGRTRVSIGRRDYDLRVSVIPSLHGENIVVRILPTTMLFGLDELGLSEAHRTALDAVLGEPHGILFLTGPTGSGKTTTLYACLSRLNTRERKIITIEDPVEYELRGVMQTQIHPRIGLTFGRALRSMLRHDPDVMMVGEVRDRETAEIAIQTALTGHLVLSTLHTNDAAGGAVRLLDMGIEPYLIASTVRLFIAQRLVRRICESCREPYTAQDRRFFRGRGCRACNQTGYLGRVAVCEFLPVGEEIQSLILRRAGAHEIRARAVALGMTSLADDGWDKVARGVTTAEEVLRVTSDIGGGVPPGAGKAS